MKFNKLETLKKNEKKIEDLNQQLNKKEEENFIEKMKLFEEYNNGKKIFFKEYHNEKYVLTIR